MNKVIALKGRNSKEVLAESVAMPEAQASEVTQVDEGALRRAAEKLVTLNRKSTGHAYELGETFAEAKALVPEKRFGQWLKQFTDYSVRSAWNYISIHEKLQDYREHLLTHAVMPTVMFELAKGEPAQIEAVVAKMHAGERIRVKDVRAAFGILPKDKDASALLDIAGVAGLRKAAALKLDQDIAAFNALTSSVLKAVEIALEPLARKRAVKKGDLHDAIAFDCRHAHDLLNSIAAPLQPDATAHMNWRAARLPAGTMWGKVQAVLYRMGGSVEAWPGREDIAAWLQGDVVPVLRFVVHGEPMPAGADHVELDADDADLEELDQVA
ncbi:DUF3102 domain-containing protein [Rhizobium pusense]|uniref:DUF3102 domain-containing protein n=1 Tax=Agrobacterium pusense TaxID=648995 RepID=UPI0013009E4A|nr:DUF3102 domain-containing protein [Agrobacterium pusense]MDH0911164.1 DUF3102 domain-containing protein [Agrobacterium pusense]MDH1097233.1 DUF3102 domain-containing protein [Agrobacterium pusense]MDH1113683.1 DUF3102 domain-containing protein [Agrobacterium pusense]MDH2193205.1 DUF3102 domain-containing protein [Agrobacterium pusense]